MTKNFVAPISIWPILLAVAMCLTALTGGASRAWSQAPSQSDPPIETRTEKLNPPNRFVGDMPADPGPSADLKTDLSTKSVNAAMRKVADWQLRRAQGKADQDWTYATMYRGFLAASDALRDPRYRDFVFKTGSDAGWRLGPEQEIADNEAVAQSYLKLYAIAHDPKMLGPTRADFDRVMASRDDPAKPQWFWADALFMAPTAWVQFSNATDDPRYTAYMNHQFAITSKLLYNQQDHLYSRDASYLDRHEKNGRLLYWSRGNGWVMGGLVGLLENLPTNDPHRPFYRQQFVEMAKAVAAIQGPDGLWRAGLLDPDSYRLPEVSGSAFFIYAMAWGIRTGLLNRATYLPVVATGWAGLVSHVYADGRLGAIQPIGAAPGRYTASSTFVFGTGAFLLAGAEIDKLNAAISRHHASAARP